MYVGFFAGYIKSLKVMVGVRLIDSRHHLHCFLSGLDAAQNKMEDCEVGEGSE